MIPFGSLPLPAYCPTTLLLLCHPHTQRLPTCLPVAITALMLCKRLRAFCWLATLSFSVPRLFLLFTALSIPYCLRAFVPFFGYAAISCEHVDWIHVSLFNRWCHLSSCGSAFYHHTYYFRWCLFVFCAAAFRAFGSTPAAYLLLDPSPFVRRRACARSCVATVAAALAFFSSRYRRASI